MPRPPRIKGDGIHYHVILRCNNGEYLLQENDFQNFLTLLGKESSRFSFTVYNYTLLNSHAHLILSTHKQHFIDEIMHSFCTKYSREFNKRHKRSGHLWKNRYRCKLITTDLHALACLRYQHRNPDKARMVSEPGQWPWSGYHFYAEGTPNHLLKLHPSYLGLAEQASQRQAMYKKFVQKPLSQTECDLFEKRRIVDSKRFQESIKKQVLLALHEVSGSS